MLWPSANNRCFIYWKLPSFIILNKVPRSDGTGVVNAGFMMWSAVIGVAKSLLMQVNSGLLIQWDDAWGNLDTNKLLNYVPIKTPLLFGTTVIFIICVLTLFSFSLLAVQGSPQWHKQCKRSHFKGNPWHVIGFIFPVWKIVSIFPTRRLFGLNWGICGNGSGNKTVDGINDKIRIL